MMFKDATSAPTKCESSSDCTDRARKLDVVRD